MLKIPLKRGSVREIIYSFSHTVNNDWHLYLKISRISHENIWHVKHLWYRQYEWKKITWKNMIMCFLTVVFISSTELFLWSQLKQVIILIYLDILLQNCEFLRNIFLDLISWQWLDLCSISVSVSLIRFNIHVMRI